MPAYAEMLVSQSPSVYSLPLSAADYKPGNPGPPPLGDRSGNMDDGGVAGAPYYGGSATPKMHNYCRPASLQLPTYPPAGGHAPLQRQLTPPCLSPTGSGKGPSSPLRSCLVMRSEDLTTTEAPTLIGDSMTMATMLTTARTVVAPADTRILGPATETTDATAAEVAARNKKKVVFADDQGGQLTQVRVMREPSYMPPIWSLQFLAHVTQGMISPVPQEQWIVDFVQPASDYVRFRQKLDERNISLENVIIKETEQLIVGTVKVKNLSYHKEVILRSSCDNWKTHEDAFCTYSLVGNGAASAYLIFDTFSFKVTLPPKSRRIEFCACFKCDGVEYWDNNDGRNYSLTNRIAPRQDSGDFLPSSGAGAFGAGRNGGTATAASGFSSPYMAPGAVLDTWSDMNAETQSGPYCKAYGCVAAADRTGSDVMAPKQQQPYCEATTPPAMRPIEMELSAGGVVGGGRVVTSSSLPHNSSPWLGERRTSAGEEFALLANNNQSGRPERPPRTGTTAPLGRSASSGKLFFIRERNEGEDLLANLLRLRKLMCSQNT